LFDTPSVHFYDEPIPGGLKHVPDDHNAGEDRTSSVISSMRGSNQSGLRAYNQRLVLSLVYAHGNLAKKDISRMTGLSAQTGSVIMRELEAEDLIVKGETSPWQGWPTLGAAIDQSRRSLFLRIEGRPP
jgi:hypothetical protein